MAKKKEMLTVQCLTCRRALLRQRGKDPIVADCGYTGYKEVAATYRLCNGYEKDIRNKHIEHYG